MAIIMGLGLLFYILLGFRELVLKLQARVALDGEPYTVKVCFADPLKFKAQNQPEDPQPEAPSSLMHVLNPPLDSQVTSSPPFYNTKWGGYHLLPYKVILVICFGGGAVIS